MKGTTVYHDSSFTPIRSMPAPLASGWWRSLQMVYLFCTLGFAGFFLCLLSVGMVSQVTFHPAPLTTWGKVEMTICNDVHKWKELSSGGNLLPQMKIWVSPDGKQDMPLDCGKYGFK